MAKRNDFYFPKSKDKLLIEMVRMNPVLYDYRHKQFRSINMKSQTWENISAAIAVPYQNTKKRWRHIRDHYLRKCRISPDGRRETWEHMDRLDFLSFLSQPKASVEPTEDVPESIIYVVPPGEHDSFSETEGEPAEKRERRSPTTSPEPARLPDATQPEGYRSPVHKFFDSMADIVARLPSALVSEARLEVCRLVTALEERARAPAGAAADCCRCRRPRPASSGAP